MKGIAVPFLVITVASAVWATIAAFRMTAWLSHHGVEVNWLWFRALVPWYAGRYKRMTTEREGKPGPLFRQFLVAINLTAVFALVAAILIVAGSR